MKYKALLLTALLAAGLTMGAEAAKQEQAANPMDWNLSMMEEHSGVKKNVPAWVIVDETKFGVFAYDANSVTFLKNGKEWNKDVVEVVIKTVFTDKEIIRQLNTKYALKLVEKEKTEHWLLHMRFNLVDNTYAIKKTEYFGNKGSLLDTINRKVNMVPIPEESFAANMCQLCREWAMENQEIDPPKK